MSGIVGVVNLDGAPLEQDWLQQMTEFMVYRGPDAQNLWLEGAVGFGHTMLRTTPESQREHQPCSLDGQVWIVADARIDGQSDLCQKLQRQGCFLQENVPDVELILQAYQVWDEDCVQHLLGDFAFAIWDGRRQRLFCARDQFGVKPFYYAHVGRCLLFGNTLNCLRLHPTISAELNDWAIADFLLFGLNQDPTTTTFADIQRLPPAHTLTWSAERRYGSQALPWLSRYWTLPADGHIRYRNPMDYVEHFQTLMHQAVSDRLRHDRVGIFMSGGLDSTAIAAVAKQVLSEQSSNSELQAFTAVYDRLIPDQERYYAGLAAATLNIPVHYLVADDYMPYERWNSPAFRRPEPVIHPLLALQVDQFQQAASYSRVVLDGEGGDPVLFPANSYFINQLKALQWGPLIQAIWQYVRFSHRLPAVGLRTQLRSWLNRASAWQPPYPSWLNSEFANDLDLPERWQQFNQTAASCHPTRPEAYQVLLQPDWPTLFENCDPGVTQFPVEVRHPYFDLRLVSYLLAIPPLPWFVHKELVRVAMRGLLPDPVRRRPKTPLVGDPLYTLLQQPERRWIDNFELPLELTKYIDRSKVPSIAGIESNSFDPWLELRPLSLVYWFQNLEQVNSKFKEEFYEIKG